METPDNGGEWGILGGTFDPVHFGHINLASEILTKKNLNGILFVIVGNHPFKQEPAPSEYKYRLEMLEIALRNYNNLIISKIEEENNLSGYTIDTIIALKKKFPQADFHFIIGADNISTFDKWHQPEKLMNEVDILLGARPGYDLKALPKLPNDNYEIVEIDLFDASSTEIRTLLKRNTNVEKLNKLIPNKVLNYITENGLYR